MREQKIAGGFYYTSTHIDARQFTSLTGWEWREINRRFKQSLKSRPYAEPAVQFRRETARFARARLSPPYKPEVFE